MEHRACGYTYPDDTRCFNDEQSCNHCQDEGCAADYSIYDAQMLMVQQQEQDEFDADCD